MRWCSSWRRSLLPTAHAARAIDSNWPQFRGPLALGTADNSQLPDTWNATENIAWTRDIAGRGWSSPIVWGNRVFVSTVTSEESLKDKDKKRGLYLGGNRSEPATTDHQWHVLCLDLADGSVLWDEIAHQGVPPESTHLKNTLASETPVTDGERLYVYFGNLGVFCFSLEGKPLWSRHVRSIQNGIGLGNRKLAHIA